MKSISIHTLTEMTSGPNELMAAMQRLIDGNASEPDRDAVRTALNTGVLVTGERAVAIGGNASDVNKTSLSHARLATAEAKAMRCGI